MRRSKRVQKILNALSLGAVLQYSIFRFLQSTMFPFYYSNMYKIATMCLLLVFGGIRYLFVIVHKLKDLPEKKEKTQYLIRCLFAWCLAFPFFYTGWKYNYKPLIFLPFCCMCLYDIEAGKVFKAFAFVIGTLLAATVLCCLSGTVRNLVYVEEGQVIGSFGIINTTDFASYFTFLLLIIWCGIKKEEWYHSLLFLFFTGITVYTVFTLTHSKTFLITGILIVFCFLWNDLFDNVFKKSFMLSRAGKRINSISVFVFPAMGVCAAVLAALYGKQNNWTIDANRILSGRIQEIWLPYQKYGIHLFGSQIESLYGNGGTLIPIWSAGYGYFDTAYALLAIRYGLVITGIVTGLWIWMTARALRAGQQKIALAMSILAIHAFSEARIMDVNYNIFLIMPFCAFSKNTDDEAIILEKKVKLQRFSIISFILFAMIGVNYFILPKTVSWLRTLFALKGWNTGIQAIWSLIICVCFVILLYSIGVVLRRVCYQKSKKKYAALLCGLIILLAGSIGTINSVINQACADQQFRIQEEEGIIKQIQSSASQPVYAAEASELYQRTIGGFSEHSFSTEELYRYPKGSIITDNYVEALSLLAYGARYTQLSPWSSIYSFDSQVIDFLDDAGYMTHTYYDGTHVCNLSDMAFFNGLKLNENGKIELAGGASAITKNAESDQFGGGYVVTFTLKASTKPDDNKAIGCVKVLGEAGETVITQEEILSSDCDSDGFCTKALTYWIPSTPKVSYEVSVYNGISMVIDQIEWKRILM